MTSSPSTSLRVENVFNVSGMVAIVTGGGTGIGSMIARTLASNGAKVYIISRRIEVLENCVKDFDKDQEQTSQGGKLIALVGDLGTKSGIEKLKLKMEELEPSLDLLVCLLFVLSLSSRIVLIFVMLVQYIKLTTFCVRLVIEIGQQCRHDESMPCGRTKDRRKHRQSYVVRRRERCRICLQDKCSRFLLCFCGFSTVTGSIKVSSTNYQHLKYCKLCARWM